MTTNEHRDKPMVKVELYCDSHSMHLAQLYTGFGELQRRGKIDCRWIISKVSSRIYGEPYLKVTLNNRWLLLYDESDDYRISENIDLSKLNILFKRNFNPTYVQEHPHKEKILPLGLNYFVLGRNDHRLQRILRAKNDIHKLRNLLKQFAMLTLLLPVSVSPSVVEISAFEDIPSLSLEPSVLFIAQVWRPERVKSEEHKQDRYQINEMRANLVRVLRREFGQRYIGGLIPNDYAIKYYSDCLIDNEKITTKKNFLRIVKQIPICVTSNGLLGSIGYKFAEYIAAARAIVSERNVNQVYGDFREGQNYLSFTSADECAEMVQTLFDHPELCMKMMYNNFLYYHLYLRPDMLVLNSLHDALRFFSQNE